MARPTEWRRVPTSPYRNYEVSEDGRVRRDNRELVGSIDRQGYRDVLLSYAGIKRRFKVNRLVCEAYHGPPPIGFHAAHLNGDPSDNCAANLQWKTPADNNADKRRHGTHQAGALHPRAKLSLGDVAAVRASKLPHRALARQLGVGEAAIRKIRKGDRWA